MAGHEWQDLVWQAGNGRQWPPEARLLAAYLLTGPATNRIGCIPFTFEAAAHHTGLSAERVSEIVAYFVAEEFARFDPGCCWIWVPDVLRMHVFTSTEEVRRALPELALVPPRGNFPRRTAAALSEFGRSTRRAAKRRDGFVSGAVRRGSRHSSGAAPIGAERENPDRTSRPAAVGTREVTTLDQTGRGSSGLWPAMRKLFGSTRRYP